MAQRDAILLAEMPADRDDARLAVYLVPTDAGSSIALVQEAWADGIGWFAQSRIEVDPTQVGPLRQFLSQTGSHPRPAMSTRHNTTLRVVG